MFGGAAVASRKKGSRKSLLVCAQRWATIRGLTHNGEARPMWQSAPTGSNLFDLDCDTSRIHSHSRNAKGTTLLKTLLMADDPKLKDRVISAIRMTPAEVHCVSTVRAALFALAHNSFDIMVIDRHLGGWVSAQTCKDLVVRACGAPVVGLIDADCVLGPRDGIESGLTGAYYKDQINVHLMRRLGRLAYLPTVDASLVATPAPRFGSAS